MAEPTEKLVERFLKELMDIQRKYGNEMKNAKTKRQEEVRDLLEKCVAKETADAD
jgi:4-hydroxy-3-methylbut-2-enyl diphosphate reductase IspH